MSILQKMSELNPNHPVILLLQESPVSPLLVNDQILVNFLANPSTTRDILEFFSDSESLAVLVRVAMHPNADLMIFFRACSRMEHFFGGADLTTWLQMSQPTSPINSRKMQAAAIQRLFDIRRDDLTREIEESTRTNAGNCPVLEQPVYPGASQTILQWLREAHSDIRDYCLQRVLDVRGQLIVSAVTPVPSPRPGKRRI